MIVFFRGKAATGKSTLAQEMQSKLNYAVISKDSVFDVLLNEGYSWSEASDMSYEKLALMIQHYHDTDQNVIVDIGLAHTPYFDQFLSSMNLKHKSIRKYHFLCSDSEIWENRIQKRIENPAGPNQAFKSINEANTHYQNYEIYTKEDEVEMDSVETVNTLFDIICNDMANHMEVV